MQSDYESAVLIARPNRVRNIKVIGGENIEALSLMAVEW